MGRRIKKKTWTEDFKKILKGEKHIDFRAADFDVEDGDVLILKEWDPNAHEYTGRIIEKEIRKVHHFTLNSFGQQEILEKKGFYIMELV